MTQRQIGHAAPLPPCMGGHAARHILDQRRATAGGGHFIECRCCATRRHASYDLALQDWGRMQRIKGRRDAPHLSQRQLFPDTA